MVKLGFTGVYIIFLISAQKHSLWVLVRTASCICFDQKLENISEFFIWKISVFGGEMFNIFEQVCFHNVFVTVINLLRTRGLTVVLFFALWFVASVLSVKVSLFFLLVPFWAKFCHCGSYWTFSMLFWLKNVYLELWLRSLYSQLCVVIIAAHTCAKVHSLPLWFEFTLCVRSGIH